MDEKLKHGCFPATSCSKMKLALKEIEINKAAKEYSKRFEVYPEFAAQEIFALKNTNKALIHSFEVAVKQVEEQKKIIKAVDEAMNAFHKIYGIFILGPPKEY